ncbi:MAG: glycosyltransferase family 4 protein, partial [Myxococcota bacterium]
MADALDILVVSQFFSPEMGAPAARFHDFGRLLVERGHRVRIITGFPNSPSGIVADGYRRRLAQREWIDGIEVLRGWLYASPRLTRLTKSLGFGTFALSASMRAVLGRPKADVVIATSPPPTVGIPGMLAARLLGAPLVFDVRDIWPEAIAASGRLQSGLVIRFLESIERAIYRNAEAVTVVTEGKRARLIEKGVPEDKVTVIPNGVDLSRFEELTVDRDQLLAGYGLEPSAFIVVYAGIFNPAQGLDVLLDAAKSLRRTRASTARPVQFALVGGGSQRERLSQRITEEELHPG